MLLIDSHSLTWMIVSFSSWTNFGNYMVTNLCIISDQFQFGGRRYHKLQTEAEIFQLISNLTTWNNNNYDIAGNYYILSKLTNYDYC